MIHAMIMLQCLSASQPLSTRQPRPPATADLCHCVRLHGNCQPRSDLRFLFFPSLCRQFQFFPIDLSFSCLLGASSLPSMRPRRLFLITPRIIRRKKKTLTSIDRMARRRRWCAKNPGLLPAASRAISKLGPREFRNFAQSRCRNAFLLSDWCRLVAALVSSQVETLPGWCSSRRAEMHAIAVCLLQSLRLVPGAAKSFDSIDFHAQNSSFHASIDKFPLPRKHMQVISLSRSQIHSLCPLSWCHLRVP
jgi:hypothetical protein